MYNETELREELFWDNITKGNIIYIFMTSEVSADFMRQIEANIDDKLKYQIEQMIVNELYIVPNFSYVYFQNCAVWLKSTKTLNNELKQDKKCIIRSLENTAFTKYLEERENNNVYRFIDGSGKVLQQIIMN